MKKFIRYLRLKRQSPADHDEHMKRKQRYEADFTLEPFGGLTPEYMEMSEYRRAWREAGPSSPGTAAPPYAQGWHGTLRAEGGRRRG